MLGNIKFIGELAKLDMLHETILHKCIKQLLDKKKRASPADVSEDMECLCHLMKTTGKKLDIPKAKPLVDQYFQRVTQIMKQVDLPARIRFMLQDVLELRRNNWLPRKVARNTGPKTIRQIHQESMEEYGIPVTAFTPPYQRRNQPSQGHYPSPPNGSQHNSKPFSGGFNNRGGMDDVFVTGPDNFAQKNFNEMGQNRNNDRSAFGTRYNDFYDEFENILPKDQWSELDNVSLPIQKPPPSTSPYGGSPYGGSPQYSPNLSHTGRPYHPYQQQQFQHHQQHGQQQYGDNRQKRYFNTPKTSFFHSNGEISLRPAKDSIAAQAPPPKLQQKKTQQNKKTDPLKRTVPPIIDKSRQVKKPQQGGLSNADLDKKMIDVMAEFLKSYDVEEAVKCVVELKTQPGYMVRLLSNVMSSSMERTECDREAISNWFAALHKKELFTQDDFLKSLTKLLEQLTDLEIDVPHVKTYTAGFMCRAAIQNVVSLADLAKPFDNGDYYPTLLLCFQGIKKSKGQEWLVQKFNDSMINMLTTLPELDRNNERMINILGDKGLNCLFPLLRVQSEITKQLENDSTVSTLYKWIKENVEISLHDNPKFINILITCILKHVTKKSTLSEGEDGSRLPEKSVQEKEKVNMQQFQPLLLKFLHESVNLQVGALYALQVFCHSQNFPKGLLLRMFNILYDMEVVEEEAFIKWKEDVSDEHPGKGRALFQVNSWLTWLETADEEGSDSDGD